MSALASLSDFDLGAGTALGAAPLVTLTLGIVLLLVAEVVRSMARHRDLVFAATLLSTAWCEFLLLRHPIDLPIFQGTYAADPPRALWGLVFLASAGVAWGFGRRYFRASQAFLGEHDVLLLATPLGMHLMAGAQDLVVFFVGLELLSVPLYCLAAFRRRRDDSVEAGLKYFVLGAFASATFLYGAALIYTGSGTLSLTELRGAALGEAEPLVTVGTALVASSLFFKVGVFPFHLWVPDVYQGSPTPIAALMATGTKAAGFAFLIGACLTGEGQRALLPAEAAPLVAWIALVTMLVGNLSALVQSNLKRMLAWSGVAHAGTLLLLVAAGLSGPADEARLARELFNREVMEAAIYYMAAYVFTAGGAFGLIAWLEADGEHFTELASLEGLSQRRPKIAAALALFMLSLGGIPATGGFLGKYFVFSATVHAGMTGIAVAGVLTSVVALGYYLRVVVALYMRPAPEDVAPPLTQRRSAAIAMALCAAMVLVLGFAPAILLGRF